MKYYFIVVLLLNLSCDFSKKRKKVSENQIDYCKGIVTFHRSENIIDLFHDSNDSIPFLLKYDKQNHLFYDEICFTKIDFIFKSKDYQNKVDLYLGLRNDSLFVGEFYDSEIKDALFLFSMKNDDYPKQIKNTVLFPQSLRIDSIYFKNNEKIFRIDSFYDLPHDDPPKYTFYKYYISKERGIFKLEVQDKRTKKIYSSK